MLSRRLFLSQLLWLLVACGKEKESNGKLTIGIVSYGEGSRSIEQYGKFRDYLASQVSSIIELEPAFNEIKALDQLQRGSWSLVFASPGLAAIAISKHQYIPLFPLQGVNNLRSVLVVLQDSPVQKLSDLNGKVIAIGQPGSATGYYVPIYDLYGLTLAEVIISSTPKALLEQVDQGMVAAGALSKDEFERYRPAFSSQRFRVLHSGSQPIPAGSVLLGPTVDYNQQQRITEAMKLASPSLVEEAGYIPNAPVPDYKFLIQVVERVRPIVTRIRQKPAPLYEEGRDTK